MVTNTPAADVRGTGEARDGMSEDILVTGGSGSVGQPIVRALVAAGHRVRMLTRRDESARRAIVLGARPVRGGPYRVLPRAA